MLSFLVTTGKRDVASAEANCARLRDFLSYQPLSFQMVSRVITAPSATSTASSSTSLSSRSLLLEYALSFILRIIPTDRDGNKAGMTLMAQHVLSSPGLAANAATSQRMQLADIAFLRTLMRAVVFIHLPSPRDYLSCAANLAELVAGPRPRDGAMLQKSYVLFDGGLFPTDPINADDTVLHRIVDVFHDTESVRLICSIKFTLHYNVVCSITFLSPASFFELHDIV
jgi:hypothetical protein